MVLLPLPLQQVGRTLVTVCVYVSNLLPGSSTEADRLLMSYYLGHPGIRYYLGRKDMPWGTEVTSTRDGGHPRIHKAPFSIARIYTLAPPWVSYAKRLVSPVVTCPRRVLYLFLFPMPNPG